MTRCLSQVPGAQQGCQSCFWWVFAGHHRGERGSDGTGKLTGPGSASTSGVLIIWVPDFLFDKTFTFWDNCRLAQSFTERGYVPFMQLPLVISQTYSTTSQARQRCWYSRCRKLTLTRCSGCPFVTTSILRCPPSPYTLVTTNLSSISITSPHQGCYIMESYHVWPLEIGFFPLNVILWDFTQVVTCNSLFALIPK